MSIMRVCIALTAVVVMPVAGVSAYGSLGFGAWRELAANTMTTNWVLAKQTEAFPLMYHWRVLPGTAPLAEELADIDRVVAYRDSSAAVRRRVNALAQASASVALFLEYIPQRLDTWLTERGQLAAGPDAVAAACLMVQQRLSADNDFYWNLYGTSRTTPYPAREITRALAAIPDLAPEPRAPATSRRCAH